MSKTATKTRLEQSIASLIDTRVVDEYPVPGIYVTVGVLVRDKKARHTEPGGGGKLVGSPFPGETAMFNLVTDVDAGARRAEAELREALHYAGIVRGGTVGNTIAALRALPALVEAYVAKWPTCPRTDGRHGLSCGGVVVDYLPHVVEALVAQWVDRGLVLLDEQEPWTPVPEDAGIPTLCPYCRRRSLRWQETFRRMRCVNGACVDDDGNDRQWTPDDLAVFALETATGVA
jgi:hypothetical protein